MRAVFMTEEQVSELVAKVQHKESLWALLKDRELNQFDEHGSAKLPLMAMAVSNFVEEIYGSAHTHEIGSLIIALRFHVRQELELPV